MDWRQYDFLDLGASTGKSLKYCCARFGADQGLGIDIDPTKVDTSLSQGLHVVQADARSLGLRSVVRFVSMMDFLEHLPNLASVGEVIRSAAESATDFLFISHPSFEGEAYLRSLGLCQYWHNWTGHPTHISIADYCTMFEQIGLSRYMIRYREAIHDSEHPSIVPATGPRNSGPYDPPTHGLRERFSLEAGVWRAQEILVALSDAPITEWRGLAAPP